MNEEQKGCYFWINQDTPEDERCMSVMCIKCHDEHHPDLGGFWDFANGCGPWDIVCDECGHTIRKYIDHEAELMKEIDDAFRTFVGKEEHE